MRAAVTYLAGQRWADGVVMTAGAAVHLIPDADVAGLPRLDGVVTGGFTDAHVHLQLVDAAALADSALGAVTDLGGDPAALSALPGSGASGTGTGASPAFVSVLQELRTRHRLRVGFAGAFLTPPGGYPSDRAWARAGSVREIPDADAAANAIVEMKTAGAICVKVASNLAAGPVFTDELFRAVVEIAASHGLPVIAHAEGPGEAQRAARLGATMLAHAPFTERLTDLELAEMRGVTWVSTLAIHDGEAYETAVDNVRRFHAIGGDVAYGTDMGNGPMPVGLNAREIAALRAAGIDGTDLLRALTPEDPTHRASRLVFIAGATPETADPLTARLLTPAVLEASS